jgi:hypothetical protein
VGHSTTRLRQTACGAALTAPAAGGMRRFLQRDLARRLAPGCENCGAFWPFKARFDFSFERKLPVLTMFKKDLLTIFQKAYSSCIFTRDATINEFNPESVSIWDILGGVSPASAARFPRNLPPAWPEPKLGPCRHVITCAILSGGPLRRRRLSGLPAVSLRDPATAS